MCVCGSAVGWTRAVARTNMTKAMPIKNTTKIMSMIKFSSEVFRMFVMAVNNKNEKMTETRALVWLLLATALRS